MDYLNIRFLLSVSWSESEAASVPRKAPMCCVIPPASMETVWVDLRASSRVVFPWST